MLSTVPLGRTGLMVSRLGYGAMELRGPRIEGNPPGRPITIEDARSVLFTVLDVGINFIDTSNDYGQSEELIGQAIGTRRSEYYLATKCGCRVQQRADGWMEVDHVYTRDNLFRGLHESLQRLRTDYVDLIQLHGSTPQQCEQEDLVGALLDMKQQGKARWIGISTKLPVLETFLQWGVFDVFQLEYSALLRRNEEWISKAAEAGTGIVVRGGVAKGEPGKGTGRSELWQLFAAANLDELRDPAGSRTAFMLRFALSHPHAHTIIIGSIRPEHIRENARAAARGPLAADVYIESRKRLERIGVVPTAIPTAWTPNFAKAVRP